MRRPDHRSFVTTAVLATALMVAAPAGCGGTTTGARQSPDPAAPVSEPVDQPTLVRALQATRAVQSGRVEVETALTHVVDHPDPPAGGRLTVATYRVAFDLRARRVEVETDMSGAAGAVAGRDAGAGADLAVPARMVADGDVVYAQGGPMAAAVGRAATDWVEIDRGAFVARGPSSDAAALLIDPLAPFQAFGDATTDARVVGHDVIRGSPVTHLAGSAGSEAVAVPVGIWIDADGVIRRMEIRLAGDVAAGGGGIITTVELFDIGGPVDIEPPAGVR